MAKPIQVHLTPSGPNPWKVVLILEELEIPYEVNSFPFENVKDKAFTDLNPNGRVPAIIDPNTGITLWESGAIVQYLVEQYDKNKILTYDTLQGKHHLNQWLMFQMSGQDPYFGTSGWFNHLHPEKFPSAIERYNDQARRVLRVLDGWLEGKQWLVGEKVTYADLSFVPWNNRFDQVVATTPENMFDGFPNVKAWHEQMTSRPAWKRAMTKRDQLMDDQGLLPNGMPKTQDNYQAYVAGVNAKQDGK